MKKILLTALGMALLIASCTQTKEKEAVFTPPTIVNDTSTVNLVKNVEMEVRSKNGKTVINVEKDGVKEEITMADWEANKKMYEDKYGVLPPPPPPPLPPPPPPPAPELPPPPPPPPVKN